MAVAEGRAAPDRAPRLGPRGGIQSMPTYSSAEGIPIRAGDRYAITATYNNTTEKPVDAMAGLFVFFSKNE